MPSSDERRPGGTTSTSPVTKARSVSGMRGLDLEPDHRAAPAPLQRALEQAHQILGLFLDFDVAVADDAEAALRLDLVAGEQLADEGDDDLLERDEALRRRAAPRVRQADEAVDLARHAHQRAHARAGRRGCSSSSASVKPRLGMNGNGCAGSTASGVSTGKTCSRK